MCGSLEITIQISILDFILYALDEQEMKKGTGMLKGKSSKREM